MPSLFTKNALSHQRWVLPARAASHRKCRFPRGGRQNLREIQCFVTVRQFCDNWGNVHVDMMHSLLLIFFSVTWYCGCGGRVTLNYLGIKCLDFCKLLPRRTIISCLCEHTHVSCVHTHVHRDGHVFVVLLFQPLCMFENFHLKKAGEKE